MNVPSRLFLYNRLTGALPAGHWASKRVPLTRKISSQPSLSKSKKAQPHPVVSIRNLFFRSPPKTVAERNPASRATFTKCTPRPVPETSWSKEKTGSVAHRERMKPRREGEKAGDLPVAG